MRKAITGAISGCDELGILIDREGLGSVFVPMYQRVYRHQAHCLSAARPKRGSVRLRITSRIDPTKPPQRGIAWLRITRGNPGVATVGRAP